MKMIISISILAIIVCALILIKKRISKNDPDKEIDNNYTKRMIARYK
ncbi:MAG: hypothetical protein GY754_22345 [bacterium]|nr:hypothetical protein [bacterium]